MTMQHYKQKFQKVVKMYTKIIWAKQLFNKKIRFSFIASAMNNNLTWTHPTLYTTGNKKWSSIPLKNKKWYFVTSLKCSFYHPFPYFLLISIWRSLNVFDIQNKPAVHFLQKCSAVNVINFFMILYVLRLRRFYRDA